MRRNRVSHGIETDTLALAPLRSVHVFSCSKSQHNISLIIYHFLYSFSFFSSTEAFQIRIRTISRSSHSTPQHRSASFILLKISYFLFLTVYYSTVGRILCYWLLLSFPFSHYNLLQSQRVCLVRSHGMVSCLAIFPPNTFQ